MNQFKIFNTSLYQQQQIDSLIVNEISQSTPVLKNVFTVTSGQSLNAYTLPNETVIYCQSGSTVAITVDSTGSSSPPIGTEYTVVTGINDQMYFRSLDSSVAIQLSNNSSNVGNPNIVAMAVNCRCTILKVSPTTWIVQGDGLQYSD